MERPSAASPGSSIITRITSVAASAGKKNRPDERGYDFPVRVPPRAGSPSGRPRFARNGVSRHRRSFPVPSSTTLISISRRVRRRWLRDDPAAPRPAPRCARRPHPALRRLRTTWGRQQASPLATAANAVAKLDRQSPKLSCPATARAARGPTSLWAAGSGPASRRANPRRSGCRSRKALHVVVVEALSELLPQLDGAHVARLGQDLPDGEPAVLTVIPDVTPLTSIDPFSPYTRSVRADDALPHGAGGQDHFEDRAGST